ncbi:MAG: WYL domain-containing protein [Acholeplasmataceae bacterium]|nr:WYL domain-containing protein [Acholeplasmataceae bacterium]
MTNNYGFIINEESRQHINLSTRAMTIIEADMIRFIDDFELKNRSGFMNTIISNYYESFPLSRAVALKQINAIQKAITTDNFSDIVTLKVVDEFTNEMMKNTIKEYADKYSSDVHFKLKLNKENTLLLESLEDASYFEAYAPRSGTGFYLKIILESYAVQTREIRERIYYKETIDKIEESIKRSKMIKYKVEATFNKIYPYKIFKPSDNHSLELIYGIPDKDSKSITFNTIKVKTLLKNDVRTTGEKFKDSGLEDIVTNLFKQRASVSAKPIETFTVEFTYGGLQRLVFEEDSLPIIGIPDTNNKYLYTFKTTETQIFFHLFKFGSQAKIISPLDARDRFKKLYKASFDAYELMDAK